MRAAGRAIRTTPSPGITAASADELKAAAGTLGDAFRADLSAPINGGYPILRWQYVDPNATYTVTIRVEPADSVLTWNGEEQPGQRGRQLHLL